MLISGYCLQNLFLGKSKVVSFLMLMVRIIVLKAAFNNISVILCLSVLLLKKTEVPGENHRPAIRQ